MRVINVHVAVQICLRWAAVACLLIAQLGCTSLKAPVVAPADPALLHQVFIAPPYIPGHILEEPGDDFMTVTPAMRAFVKQTVPDKGSSEKKLNALFRAFTTTGTHPIQYDPQATFTAEEVYRQGRGNCLAFSAMFIALAREVGLTASFQEVDVPPAWDAINSDTLIQYRHVNVKVKVRGRNEGVIDLRIDRYSESFPQRKVADNVGLAHHYSNLSMQHLLNSDLNRAYVYARAAILADKSRAFIWNNMGIIQRRLGYLDLAEASYRQALTLDSQNWSAMNNLAYIEDVKGNPVRGAELRALAKRARMRNPYYNYAMAQNAYRNGEYEDAFSLVNTAVSRYRREHRFYYLRGLSRWKLGEPDAAIRDLKRAIAMGKRDSVSYDDLVLSYQLQLEKWENSG